jgi:twitching motility protein PilU
MTHDIFSYLRMMNEKGGSDLYLTVGVPPTLRVDHKTISLDNRAMRSGDLLDIMTKILGPKQLQMFEEHRELNTSLDTTDAGRFRINVMRQRQLPALVIRRISSAIPNFAELKLPSVLEKLAMTKRGLILVTGMTGSGKSTTLASMIDYRNKNEQGHIVTIEDPIEYFHDHQRSIVSQREVGVDTESYAIALKNVLRQRPDVILVGEIRDVEVMEQALQVAETGHLCLSTLHTNNTYQAIERIINMFPEDYHDQVRLNLAMNLRAIISQRLVPTKNGGMHLVSEVLINEGLVKDLINDGKITKIREVIEQNKTQGMCTFDQSLLQLYTQGIITEETAIMYADMPGDLKIKLKQVRPQHSQSDFSKIDVGNLTLSDFEKKII